MKSIKFSNVIGMKFFETDSQICFKVVISWQFDRMAPIALNEFD